MLSSNLKPTVLAKVLIANLLALPTNATCVPGFVCTFTGERVKGMCAYFVIRKINSNAVGPFYSVFGYYYILCEAPVNKQKYVSVHKITSGAIVGFTNTLATSRTYV